MTRGNEARMKHRSPKWARSPLGQKRLIEAAEKLVRKFGIWSVFLTLTFKVDEVSDRKALEMTRTFLRAIAEGTGAHVPFVLAMGPQWRGVPHVHLLLQASPENTESILRNARSVWRKCGFIAGRMDVQAFDPENFGIRYVLRHDYWDCNVACPRFLPCKRLKNGQGCKEAPGPWK